MLFLKSLKNWSGLFCKVKVMRQFRRIAAIIIGFVFLVSSLTKLADPVGTSLICEAYFKWLHVGFLSGISKFFGVVISLAEAFAGIALITGVWRRITALVTMAMMAVFTVLSLALLVFNPQMDCGCFGQIIHLEHWQTLVKNCILDLLCVAAFIPMGRLGEPRKRRYVSFALSCAAVMAFCVFSLNTNPLVDEMDYKPSTTLVLEEDIPEDTGYKFLTVLDGNGADVSGILLEGDVALVSVYDADKLSSHKKLKIASFAQTAMAAGYTPVLLANGDPGIPGLDCHYADRKVILSINRTNGGYTYIKDGYIVLKKSHLPSFETLEEEALQVPEDLYIKTASQNTIAMQLMGISLLAILLLI